MSAKPIVVGEIEVIPISDGIGKLPPNYFVNSDWSAHQALLGPDGMVDVPIGAFIVHTGDLTVLVDTGLGTYSNPLFETGALPDELVAAGTDPADVDLVVLTHLHMDHCGWLVRDEAPFFPKATVRFGGPDWDHFVAGHEGPENVRQDFRILEEAGRLDPVSADGEAIAPGLTTRMAPGHTPGHQCLIVSSGADRLVLLGDAVTCPVQLEEPEWQAVSDTDPQLAQRTREALWRELEGTDDLAVAAHFPDLQFGRVLAGQGKRYFGPA